MHTMDFQQTVEAGRAGQGPFLEPLEGRSPADILCSDLKPPELGITHFCILSPWSFDTGTLGKPYTGQVGSQVLFRESHECWIRCCENQKGAGGASCRRRADAGAGVNGSGGWRGKSKRRTFQKEVEPQDKGSEAYQRSQRGRSHRALVSAHPGQGLGDAAGR